MAIVFLYESRHPIEVKDGLSTALAVLGRTIEVRRINIAAGEGLIEPKDFILAWGAFGSKVDMLTRLHPNKKGLCIGGATEPYETLAYDVLFYETKWYREKIKFHPNIVHAFGIDTDTYYDMKIDRDVDYLGVGAFAAWKRWELMLKKKGSRRVIGEYQVGNIPESEAIWNQLEDDGVICKNMMTAKNLNFEYNRAKTVYIPATIMGGGERAVLEARVCGCEVEVEQDNPKLLGLLNCPIYDVNYYVKQLREGINGLL